ncbi:slipin family protein [Tautonia plasticadhaerens]|uniref:FtsH protease regulator HflK n=1 Tax=Tautonia plasticadhaerens TaxID=2527974 RepID=A0A518GXJ5_9BACT|nr:slipin family protein [Tautonia plasticadhaerens]QDV33310.1 FtsH protease regulator HflK [Tautonia plasticadhaerens]
MFPMIRRVVVRSFEQGLLFRRGEFRGLVGEGTHWFFDPLGRIEVEVVSMRAPRLVHDRLDLIVKSGALKPMADVVDLKDDRRALVWIDGRFSHVLGPGLHAYWTGPREVRVEVVETRRIRFEHEDLKVIARSTGVNSLLDVCSVNRNHAGVLFLDGQYAETLEPGLHAFWRGPADARVVEVDLREATLDVGGQEIMTADKVTLRLNALVTYVVSDPRRTVCTVDDYRQALYREAQLALRVSIGARELDALLADKDEVARETEAMLRDRASALGLEVRSAGIRDLILPGEMRDLMNKVTEARKAAEANLITRREETAALRSQANTAKLLAEQPMLMKLRELEALERIASTGHLNIMLGEKGLADRVVNLL